jgi:hypothetical protein
MSFKSRRDSKGRLEVSDGLRRDFLVPEVCLRSSHDQRVQNARLGNLFPKASATRTSHRGIWFARSLVLFLGRLRLAVSGSSSSVLATSKLICGG